MGEYFDINIMQRNNDPRYVDNVLAQLEELGIALVTPEETAVSEESEK